MLSVSVSELFPSSGSVTPPGAATCAELVSDPVAAADSWPVALNVAVPPGSNVTGALMLPLPPAGQDDPPLAEHVQVTPERVAGNVSVTIAAGDPIGPPCVTWIA